MQRSIVKLMSLIILNILSANAIAKSDQLELGIPVIGGNGCSKNSSSVQLNNNKDVIQIRFSDYFVIADEQRSLDRKSCNLAIPLHIPEGYSVAVVEANYHGFLSLPENSTLDLNTEYFFVGEESAKLSRQVTGEAFGDFQLTDAVLMENEIWSKCGEDTIMRVNTSMLLKNKKSNELAIAVIDSADINSGILYQIKMRKCHK